MFNYWRAVVLVLGTACSVHSFEEWVNCVHLNCPCTKSLDCYDGEPGVCMIPHGESYAVCRYCPVNQGLIYHLPDEPLSESIPTTSLCVPVVTCKKKRCFDGTCERIPGFEDYNCRCRPGYISQELTIGVERCVDVNECASNRSWCPKNSQCINTIGSFECRCLPGFRAHYDDGLRCEDIDECVTLGFEACAWYLNCLNEEGSYRCANLLQEWLSNEVFIVIVAGSILIFLNLLVCFSCRRARRSLGIEDNLPVRKRHKEINKYCVARL